MNKENIREGYPYDNPRFEALCREHGISGTAESALCAVFWRAAIAQPVAGDAITAKINEMREILDETYSFAATSPRSQKNINAVCDLLDDIAALTQANRRVCEHGPAWAQGIGVPGVSCGDCPIRDYKPTQSFVSDTDRALERYMAANYPDAQGATLAGRVIDALEKMDIDLGMREIAQPAVSEAHKLNASRALPVVSPERGFDLYDEIECDLASLFGRASAEGHESGQFLAEQVRQKMKRAREASTQGAPAQAAGVPDLWIKSSDLEQAKRFGGSINAWLEKYDCDVLICAAAPTPTEGSQS